MISYELFAKNFISGALLHAGLVVTGVMVYLLITKRKIFQEHFLQIYFLATLFYTLSYVAANQYSMALFYCLFITWSVHMTHRRDKKKAQNKFQNND